MQEILTHSVKNGIFARICVKGIAFPHTPIIYPFKFIKEDKIYVDRY